MPDHNTESLGPTRYICLTETWLTGNIPDANVDIPGFTTVRADRDTKLSSKSKGGGLVLFVNIRWCNPGHVTVKEIICSRDITDGTPGTPVSVCLDITTSSAPTDIHATLLDADGTDITTPSTPSSHIKASELICSTAIAPPPPLCTPSLQIKLEVS
ncbi:hypothetical protein SRHO_G00216300 [Serrasalmus rhombeus]